MSNTQVLDNEEIIESTICENTKEAINSEAFLRWFEIVLNHFPWISNNYYLSILKKYRNNSAIAISLDEYNDLMDLLDQEKIITIANKVFEKSLKFKDLSLDDLEWKKIKNFKLKIWVKQIKRHLSIFIFRDILSEQIDDIIDTKLLQGNIKVWDKSKKYIKVANNKLDYRIDKETHEVKVYWLDRKKWLINGAEEIREDWSKWNTILNDNLENIVSEDKNYYFAWYLWNYILVKDLWEGGKEKWLILLDKSWKQVSPEWKFYHRITINKEWYFVSENIDTDNMDTSKKDLLDKNWKLLISWYIDFTYISSWKNIELIIVEWNNNNPILFDSSWNPLTIEWDYISFNFILFNKYWFIQALEEWKDWFVILNKKWEQISPKWEYFEFDIDIDEQFNNIFDETEINGIIHEREIANYWFEQEWYFLLRNIETYEKVLFNKDFKVILESDIWFDFALIDHWFLLNQVDLDNKKAVNIHDINWKLLSPDWKRFYKINTDYIKQGYLLSREFKRNLEEENNVIFKIITFDQLELESVTLERHYPMSNQPEFKDFILEVIYKWQKELEFNLDEEKFYTKWFFR